MWRDGYAEKLCALTAFGLGRFGHGWHPGQRLATFGWLPVAVLGVGLLLGVALWAKWGFAIAFEAIRTYCF